MISIIRHLTRQRAPLLLILAAVSLAGCSKSVGGAQSAPPAPEAGFVVVKAQRVAITTELPGRTTPFLIAEVRPQVSGIVQQRKFVEGGDVVAGQTLYQIDAATYRAAYASSQAALAKAQATAAVAKLKADRYQELIGIRAVSQQDSDEVIATWRESEANVAGAKAALETDQINLRYTSVNSPISGRIGKSTVTPGALVTANQAAALTTVQQLDPMYVDVTQSSASLLRLKREFSNGSLSGDSLSRAKVKLILEDGSSYPLEGKLEFSDVTVDQNTGTITLRAVFPNPHHDLLPGMYVRAIVEQGVREQALLVPQSAVTRDPTGRPLALVIDAQNKAEQRVLQTDRTIGSQWLVSSGLRSGDRLIVEGLQRIRPGSPVIPVAAGSSRAAVAPAAAGG